MSENRKFLRKCIGCGQYKTRQNLIRITKDFKTEQININPKSGVYGRSVYICKDENCVNSAFKKMKIAKILKQNVSINLKNEIMSVLAT